MVCALDRPERAVGVAAGQAEPADDVAVEVDDAGLDGATATLRDRDERVPARGRDRRPGRRDLEVDQHLVHAGAEHQGGVVAAEAEAVGERRAAAPTTRGPAGDDVDLDVVAGALVVGRGGHLAAIAWRCSEATASTAPAAPMRWPVTPLVEVTGHGAGAEDLGDGGRLGGVVERRGRAVGVDVADVGGREAGVGEGRLHARHGADAALGRGGDVVGVAGAAVAEHLAPDAWRRGPGPTRPPRARGTRRPPPSRSRRGRRRRDGWPSAGSGLDDERAHPPEGGEGDAA